MSSSSEIVVVWGEVLWDRFPDGDQLGGAPANLAWHVGQAGTWVRLVSRVGGDGDGRRAIEQLADFVDPALIQIDPERATGEVTVRLDGAEPRYTLAPGRAWERIEYTDAVASALEEGIDVFVYGTLAQRKPEGLMGWRAAVAAARCLRVCDLNLRKTDQNGPAIAEAIAAADVLKVNDRELDALRGWFGWADPVAALRDPTRIPRADGAPMPLTVAQGARLVVVTHGADGSTLYGDGAPIRIAPTPAAPGGDHVGCGDAYLAILVHGLALGADLATSGRLAGRWAAAVAASRGATPRFTETQIADLLELA